MLKMYGNHILSFGIGITIQSTIAVFILVSKLYFLKSTYGRLSLPSIALILHLQQKVLNQKDVDF